MLLKESGEIALRAKAEVFGNIADLVLLQPQTADRGFDAKRVGVKPRADTGAVAEQMIEVRPGKSGGAGDIVEIDGLVRHGRAYAAMRG